MEKFLQKVESWNAFDPRELSLELHLESLFYYPNMCHVCHSFGEQAMYLKLCPECKMISYCCPQHQKRDWPNHRDFCKAICEIQKDLQSDNIFDLLKTSDDPHKSISKIMDEATSRLQLKGSLIRMIGEVLQRPFKPCEIAMICHPRVCAVCFESNHLLLANCVNCPQSSFCREHLNDSNHKKVCPKLWTTFLLECEGSRITEMRKKVMNVKIPNQKEIFKLPSSITEFIETYVQDSAIKDPNSREKSIVKIAVISDRFSIPLSLIFSLEKLRLIPGSKMLIHVMRSGSISLIAAWEIILHWYPQLSELKIVVMAPKIMSGFEQLLTLCDLCQQSKKNLFVEVETSPYEEYFISPVFKKPDMIASFCDPIVSYSSWYTAMQVVEQLNCPFVTTSYSQLGAYKEQGMISSKFCSSRCVYFQPNPFASLMYARNCADEGVYSRNNFILVYKNLHSIVH